MTAAEAEKVAADKAAAAEKVAADKAAAAEAKAEKVAADKAAAAEKVAADAPAEIDATIGEYVVRTSISGLRDGKPWPAVGESISLPAYEAESYLALSYVSLPE